MHVVIGRFGGSYLGKLNVIMSQVFFLNDYFIRVQKKINVRNAVDHIPCCLASFNRNSVIQDSSGFVYYFLVQYTQMPVTNPDQLINSVACFN